MTLLDFLSDLTYAISVGALIYCLYLLGVICKTKWFALKSEAEYNEKVEKTTTLLTEITRIGAEIETDKKVA